MRIECEQLLERAEQAERAVERVKSELEETTKGLRQRAEKAERERDEALKVITALSDRLARLEEAAHAVRENAQVSIGSAEHLIVRRALVDDLRAALDTPRRGG